VSASGSRIALWLVLLSSFWGGAVSAAEQTPTIQYAEPVALSLKSSAAEFDAFGQRFSLALADNSTVLSKLSATRKAELSRVRLVKGEVLGSPGSWVRLTQTAAGVEGAIWDGHELYAVTRYDRIADLMINPLDAAPDQTVVYKFSDLRDALPQNFCAIDGSTAEAKVSGLDQYNALMSELNGQVQAGSVSRQLEISLIGDGALQASEADATAALLARLNVVEGIFSQQLGLLIIATDVRLTAPGADPFTATKGTTLLDQVGTYRSTNAAVRARGLAHLVTGKDLDGTTAGIAYVGTVCSAERGVSLSQSTFGTTVSALIMAHEIGHNLGANHDGEAGTSCSSVGGGFIMAPAVSGYATFSSCSLGVMQEAIERASCVTLAEYADVTVESPTSKVTGEGGVGFSLPFLVRANGNLTANDVTATITLPAMIGYAIETASSARGACDIEGMTARCELGSMAVGDTHAISVNARGTSAQNFNAQARVGAANDPVTSNNTRQLAVSIRSGVDAGVAISSNADDVALGAPVEVYVDVSSLRALPVNGATLSVNFNQPVTAANMPGATCSASTYAVTCTLLNLPAGNTRRLTLSATTTTAGPMFGGASVNVVSDGDFTNNTASISGWVRAAHDVDLAGGPPSLDLGVGATYDIPYTLRSRGTSDAENTRLTITLLSTAISVDAIDAACVPSAPQTWTCELGTLAAGESRTVLLRVHGTRAANADISAVASTDDDGYTINNTSGVQLRVDHAVDLAVILASGGVGVEDLAVDGQVMLRSNGRQTLGGATFDIEIDAAGTLESASVHNGTACTLLTPQRARCAVPPMIRGGLSYVNFRATFAEPGSYDATFTASAAGDTAPDNDTLRRPILVRPYNDIRVSGGIDFDHLQVGVTHQETFTVTADRRSLAAARFNAPHNLPALRVVDISASAGDCRVDAEQGGVCDFTDLAANGSVTVNVTWEADQAGEPCDVTVGVSTTGDVAANNDAVRGRVTTHGLTDLDLRVGTLSPGFRNATLTFPEITVVNGADRAFGARLEVTLPAQVALVSVSASNAICSGTTVLRCDFSELDAGSISTVSIAVHANEAGSFTSALRLTSANDSNAANDSKDLAIQVNEVTNASSTTGGKGGGRFEWFGLALLALLVALRLHQENKRVNRYRAFCFFPTPREVPVRAANRRT
jgi:hypothetical protein